MLRMGCKRLEYFIVGHEDHLAREDIVCEHAVIIHAAAVPLPSQGVLELAEADLAIVVGGPMLEGLRKNYRQGEVVVLGVIGGALIVWVGILLPLQLPRLGPGLFDRGDLGAQLHEGDAGAHRVEAVAGIHEELQHVWW